MTKSNKSNINVFILIIPKSQEIHVVLTVGANRYVDEK